MGWVSIGLTLLKAGYELWKWIKSHKQNPQAAVDAFQDAHARLVTRRCEGVGCGADLVKE